MNKVKFDVIGILNKRENWDDIKVVLKTPGLESLLPWDMTTILSLIAYHVGKGNTEAWEKFQELLDHPDPFVRKGICEVMRQVGRTEATISVLLKKLKDDYHLVRTSAAEALGEYSENKNVRAALLDVLRGDPSPDVRWKAALAIEKVRREDEVEKALLETFKELFNSEDSYRRTAVLRQLGKLGDPSAKDVISHALKDSDPMVRLEAIKLWEALKKPHELKSAVLKLAEDAHPQVREAVAGLSKPEGETGSLIARIYKNLREILCEIQKIPGSPIPELQPSVSTGENEWLVPVDNRMEKDYKFQKLPIGGENWIRIKIKRAEEYGSSPELVLRIKEGLSLPEQKGYEPAELLFGPAVCGKEGWAVFWWGKIGDETEATQSVIKLLGMLEIVPRKGRK